MKASTKTLPSLPPLLRGKIYKTGQTRGADDDVIFQNRVGRNSTVLIPFEQWEKASAPPEGEPGFENGFIALLSPQRYFETPGIDAELAWRGLRLGVNTLVLYETREEWGRYNPDKRRWTAASRRTDPLGGSYAARVPASTAASEGEKIIRGFHTTASKGAGIRIYEYAGSETIRQCRLQLEFLFWQCMDASEVAARQGMSVADSSARRDGNAGLCELSSLRDLDRLRSARLLSADNKTMCPLCLEEVSASGFFNKVEQAEGRMVPDLTITQLNLFHVQELRLGSYGHRPYNLGWGHHHCNVVVKDAGIAETVIWMNAVVDKNIEAGYLIKGT